MDIKITVPVSDQLAMDTLTTAVESGHTGIGYWAYCLEIHRDDKLNVTHLHVRADDEEDIEAKHIGVAQIHEAMKSIINGKVAVSKALRETITRAVMHDDGGDIDAEAADVLVQVAAFGEIVYG